MTHFYSTNRKSTLVNLKEAVLRGLASDGGLFMPESIPRLDEDFFKRILPLTFSEIALEVASSILQDSVPRSDLKEIVDRAINFDAPQVALSDEIISLELFHGPTLSFKDFGARFMAQLIAYLHRGADQELTILVATSGDTGSAIADGFLNVPGIEVVILYPKGRVSKIQEQQLTTMGHNITALEVSGSFDDCQALVKQAFNDSQLCQQMALTSANSISIARLIPQMFYYFYAYTRVARPVVFSVPCGNFGNLTAGLIAKRMGLPVHRFVAATNTNDTVPEYLKTGHFEARPSKHTLTNAMDVGNPSNFARMLDLYNNSVDSMRSDIVGYSFTDDETKITIQELAEKYGYTADPHGAVAYLGLMAYQKQYGNDVPGIFLETAHPAKFLDVVQPLLDYEVDIPNRLLDVLNKPKQAVEMPSDYTAFKEFLLKE